MTVVLPNSFRESLTNGLLDTATMKMILISVRCRFSKKKKMYNNERERIGLTDSHVFELLTRYVDGMEVAGVRASNGSR